ncbi:hypothetical protein [Magnetococcus sp. PR-3]|uniref:hypothetical protein n=1 Tax=Magnetococcus sp. PR-3 TaxID=3120355 RepID=UPI002FCE1383
MLGSEAVNKLKLLSPSWGIYLVLMVLISGCAGSAEVKKTKSSLSKFEKSKEIGPTLNKGGQSQAIIAMRQTMESAQKAVEQGQWSTALNNTRKSYHYSVQAFGAQSQYAQVNALLLARALAKQSFYAEASEHFSSLIAQRLTAEMQQKVVWSWVPVLWQQMNYDKAELLIRPFLTNLPSSQNDSSVKVRSYPWSKILKKNAQLKNMDPDQRNAWLWMERQNLPSAFMQKKLKQKMNRLQALARNKQWDDFNKDQIVLMQDIQQMLSLIHPVTWDIQGGIARIYESAGKYKKAEEIWSQIEASRISVLGHTYGRSLAVADARARLSIQFVKPTEQILTQHRRMLSLSTDRLGRKHEETLLRHHLYISALLEANHLNVAMIEVGLALKVAKDHLGVKHEVTQNLIRERGQIQLRRQSFTTALRSFQWLLALQRTNPELTQSQRIETRFFLALCNQGLLEHSRALQWMKELLPMAEKEYGKRDSRYQELQNIYQQIKADYSMSLGK